MSVQVKSTQNQRILDYIAEFGSITQLEALQVASRISDLRRQGYDIISERVAVNNRYGERSYIKRYSVRGADNG